MRQCYLFKFLLLYKQVASIVADITITLVAQTVPLIMRMLALGAVKSGCCIELVAT